MRSGDGAMRDEHVTDRQTDRHAVTAARQCNYSRRGLSVRGRCHAQTVISSSGNIRANNRSECRGDVYEIDLFHAETKFFILHERLMLHV